MEKIILEKNTTRIKRSNSSLKRTINQIVTGFTLSTEYNTPINKYTDYQTNNYIYSKNISGHTEAFIKSLIQRITGIFRQKNFQLPLIHSDEVELEKSIQIRTPLKGDKAH
jgi:hypothetical protein